MQLHQLGLGILEEAHIVIPTEARVHEHPTLDAADDRVGLVAGEIGAEAVTKKPEHALHLTGGAGGLLAAAVRPNATAAEEELRDRAGDVGHLQHLVGEARSHDAARHAIELRLGGVLHQHESTFGLQFARAARAVAAGAGEHDAHAEFAHGLCERREEHVDRQMQPVSGGLLGHTQHTRLDGEVGLRRVEVDRIGLDAHAVFGAHHLQRGVPPQQLHHERLMVGREVLHDHVRDAAIRVGVVEELLQSLEPTGAGADGAHGERRGFGKSRRFGGAVNLLGRRHAWRWRRGARWGERRGWPGSGKGNPMSSTA